MDQRALFEVQRLDTAIDQARYGAAHLPERGALKDASERLVSIRSRIADLLHEQGLLGTELAGIEKRDTEIATHRARLERQLKTVIAPREAEALQHQIATLVSEREGADQRGLEILEAVSVADASLTETRVDEIEASRKMATAEATLHDAETEADRVIEELSAARANLVSSIDARDLVMYESRRVTHAGVAIAEIKHGVCSGCHMEISVSELDAIKRLPSDQFAECPNCTRWLLR